MDVNQALKDTENSLRDFISLVMSRRFGQNWFGRGGIDADKIQKWEQRKEEDRKRLGVVTDERLLYYADFYDIKTLLEKNWDIITEFSAALGKKKEVIYWLEKLESFRNPEAHRRELLPHQKHLVLGIEGEIRMRLISYRNKQETKDDYYPRVEFARDSLGNCYVPEHSGFVFDTGTKLRPGDKVDFVVTARDPLGEELLFALRTNAAQSISWQKDNSFVVFVQNSDVGARFIVQMMVKSQREFRQHQEYDDDARLEYEVLPPIQSMQ